MGVTVPGYRHCGGKKGRGPDMDTSVHDYDAVIVGASFAGLAAASQLQGAGRVLLVDREPPGTGQTSACATLLAVLERLDALDALEQIHPTVTINAAGRRFARPAGQAHQLMPLIESPQCCSSKVPTLVVLQVSGCCWL